MPPEVQPPTVGCDLQRVRDFLKSDQYHLQDTELIAHLDECESCREYLESQAGEPERWIQATQLLQTSEFDQAGSADFSAATHCDSPVSQPANVQEVLDSLVPSEDPNHLGRLGTYEITGVIGVGGMGVVLKAIDPSLDRIVAVKVMSPRLANNQNARKRFAREAKAAAAVMHPNVIPIHSVSSGTSLPFLVMSYIRGGSLQKRLEEEGSLPLVEILRIGSQISAGLNAAHEQGLIHRDIKPENILLEEGVERVTITDFGLARAVDDNTITQLGAIAGTPQYMSPEQAQGQPLDQQSDLFSLGSVLYSLCTGVPPFQDPTSYGVMRKIIDVDPTSVDRLNPEIPDWMTAIVQRLMSKQKVERFDSAAEVHMLLESCLSHVQQPAGNPLPSGLRIKQPTPLRRKAMKAVLCCVALSFAAMILVTVQIVRSNASAVAQSEVRLPLDALDGFVHTMMASPYESIFLNLTDIGEDENYLCFAPIENGVSMRLPAFQSSSWSRRQGKYAQDFKKAAESLSLNVEESSEIQTDGTVDGVNFNVRVTGSPQEVTDTIRQIIAQTFQVEGAEGCKFQFRNLPSTFSHRVGDEIREVSSQAFVDEFEEGDRVYLGERENRIFLIPQELADAQEFFWDSNVWSTDIRNLSPDVLARIRQSIQSENKSP